MGVFGKVQGAKPNRSNGEYFECGEKDFHWVVLLNRCKKGPDDKPAFIGEFKVLETDCPTARVGDDRTHYIDMTQKPSAGDVVHFMMEMTGCSAEDVDEAGCESVCSEAQPLLQAQNGHSVIIRLKTWNTRKGKPNKDPFTGHKYQPIEDAAELAKYEEVARKLKLIPEVAARKSA